MSQAQIPFDSEPKIIGVDDAGRPREPRGGRRRGNGDPVRRACLVALIVLGGIAFVMAAILSNKTESVLPESFRYYRYEVLVIICGGIVSALASLYNMVFVRVRRWRWAVRVVAFGLFAALCVGGGFHALDNWGKDNAEGPVDATATVQFWEYHEETDDEAAYYTLTVLMPDGDTRKWDLREHVGNGMNPRYGDAIDVTYYRRTNIPVAMELD